MAERYRIHDVLDLLRPQHPNLSVSKIRFLEAEGTIRAVRGIDGYLRYDLQQVSAALPCWDW